MTIRLPFRRAAVLLVLFAVVILAATAWASDARQEGYPPAATPELAIPAATPLAYPPSQPVELLPMPIGGQPGIEPTPGIVGGVTDPAAGVTSPIAAQPVGSEGLLFLWLGFIATLLIFTVSVIGAITLFSRRNES